MTRVIVADDHHLVRQAIRALLEKGAIDVVGEAANGEDAVALAAKCNPDVVVMDIAMPRLDGIQAISKLKQEGIETSVVILSMHQKPNIIQRALRQGAKGYVLKSSLSDELLMAISAAAEGKIFLSPSISQTILDQIWHFMEKSNAVGSADMLTTREQEVLQLIAEGNANAEIAKLLSISIKTVEKHRANIMAKLNVHDLPTLIRVGIEYGLIFIDT